MIDKKYGVGTGLMVGAAIALALAAVVGGGLHFIFSSKPRF